jgi:hypothetical protein
MGTAQPRKVDWQSSRVPEKTANVIGKNADVCSDQAR